MKKCEGNIKSTWKIMKEIAGKAKINQKNLPKQLVINNKKITDKTEIANNFNEFFANVGPKLAEKIPDVNKNFESYIPVIDTSLFHTDLTEKEFETAFKSLKKDKASGFDKVHANVVLSVYDEVKKPLLQISKNSLKNGIVPENTKIVKFLQLLNQGKRNYLKITGLFQFCLAFQKYNNT